MATTPISPAKLAANRANAAKSTGPRTAAGKAASSQNARKHGFAPWDFQVSSVESLEQILELRADLLPFYQPVNPQELWAVEQIGMAQEEVRRVYRLGAGLLTAGMNRAAHKICEPDLAHDPFLEDDGALAITRGQKRNYFMAEGFDRMSSSTWKNFLRYRADCERSYRRAVEEFDRLKSLRPEGVECVPIQTATGFETPPAKPDSACDPTRHDGGSGQLAQTPAEVIADLPDADSPRALSVPNEPTEAAQPQQSETTSTLQNEPTARPIEPTAKLQPAPCVTPGARASEPAPQVECLPPSLREFVRNEPGETDQAKTIKKRGPPRQPARAPR